MLNLFVRLMQLRLLIPLVLLLIAAQTTPPVAITAPLAGDVLRGEITVTGTTDIENFLSAQLDFSYASNQAGNWFTIQTFSTPVLSSTLAVWNTTSISDGDYVLRLRVNLTDGTFQEMTVPIKVRNDTAVPTPTLELPTATPDSVTIQIPTPFLLAASPTPTEVPQPTPTALPTNPVSLNQNEILISLGRGALVIIGIFIFAGLIIRVRRS
jgi:hypothetical protein